VAKYLKQRILKDYGAYRVKYMPCQRIYRKVSLDAEIRTDDNVAGRTE